MIPQTHPLARLRLFAVLLIVFVLFTQIGLDPFAEDTVASLVRGSGDVSRQVGMVVLCGLLLLASFDTRNLWANVAVPASLLIMLGYCLVSVSWALDPGISIRRLGFTLLTVWFLCRAVGVLGYMHALYSLRIALVVILVLNYAALLTNHGIHGMEVDVETTVIGAWRGILGHKNVAGAICAVTILLFAFDPRGVNPALRPIVILAAAVFLWFSESKTSMAAMGIALVVGLVLPRVTELGRSVRLVVFGVILVGVLQALSVYARDVVVSLDDPFAFTGRAQIWTILLRYAQAHLWTGAGYDSFWQIGGRSPIWDYTTSWVAELTGSGHNGFLDLLVSIGLPGLVLAVVVLFLLPIARVCLDDSMPRGQRALLLSLLAFVLVHNLGESELLDRTAFGQEMLVLVLAFIAAHRQRASLVERMWQRIVLRRRKAVSG
jgi:O-antigen ligase